MSKIHFDSKKLKFIFEFLIIRIKLIASTQIFFLTKHQLNVYRVDLGGYYNESDDYKQYLSVSNTKSEKSQLDLYLEELELELNNQIEVLDYWRKSSV